MLRANELDGASSTICVERTIMSSCAVSILVAFLDCISSNDEPYIKWLLDLLTMVM